VCSYRLRHVLIYGNDLARCRRISDFDLWFLGYVGLLYY
jgi:hypothetical protein